MKIRLRVLGNIYLGLFYAFIYAPLILVAVHSINASEVPVSWKGFTLQWYHKLMQNDQLLEATLHSIVLAITSAFSATILGALAALSTFRYPFWGNRLIVACFAVLLLIPEVVLGLAWLIFFVQMNFKLGFISLFFAHTTFSLPITYWLFHHCLRSLDPSMLEAAVDLGAQESTVLSSILLPNLWDTALISFLIAFTFSFDDVMISAFLSAPDYETLPLRLCSTAKSGMTPEISALSTVLLSAAFCVAWIIYRYYHRSGMAPSRLGLSVKNLNQAS